MKAIKLMRYKTTCLYLLIMLVAISSCGGQKKEVNRSSIKKDSISLPPGAIPIYYKVDSILCICFKAVLNKSDTVMVIWDTGASRMTIPNLYKNSLSQEDTIKLKIGSNEINYKDLVYFSDVRNSGRVARKTHKNVIFTGWNLFKNKIVEVSYKDRYIRMLENTNGLASYDRIPFKIKNNDLEISLSVTIQGKVFQIKDATIDTGFNNTFISDNRVLHGLNTKNSLPVQGLLGPDKDTISGNMLFADKIKAGNVSVDSLMICITKMGELKLGNWTVTNLLGNAFLENFSVVFDFINHNLYLKPLEN